MTVKKNISIVKGILTTERFMVPYRIYENEGPHIVCVNGVQQSMGMWQTFISRFSRDLRIVLFDFPNHGKGKFLKGPKRLSLDEQGIFILGYYHQRAAFYTPRGEKQQNAETNKSIE